MRAALAAIAVVACSAPPERVVTLRAQPAPFRVSRSDPTLDEPRLPRTLVPIAYRVQLAVEDKQLSGTIEIDAELTEAIDTLWLDSEVQVRRAHARGPAGTITLEPRRILRPRFDDAKLALLSTSAMPAGRWTIEIEYVAPMSDQGIIDAHRQQSWWREPIAGVVRETYEGNAYVFTMFEPFAARRVFPCIDEPDRKVPWQLTLDVSAPLVAASNTPIVRETPLPANRKRVEFAPTPPLPSYLVAFAVGPFDIVETTASARGTPIRLLAQHGHGPAAAHAASFLAPIVDAIDAWTDIPYPYGKLDVVSVPVTGQGWFAMEHPGLITVSELGVRATTPTADVDWMQTMTHEIAHQWFGDLVTMAWWDDIWLNESFAVWMTDKIIRQLRPTTDHALASMRLSFEILSGRRGYGEAALIRAPRALSYLPAQIAPFFPGNRGAEFIAALESFLGPEAFRDAIRTYLRTHAHGTATTRDLASVFPALADVIEQTVDKTGVPTLAVELACTPSGNSARLRATTGWRVPACIAFDDGGQRAQRCVVVGDTALDIPFARCPRWISPNADGAGFYYTDWTPALADPLVARGWPQLLPRERARVIVELGRADAAMRTSTALALQSATDPLARAWSASTLAAQVPHVPAELRPALVRALRPVFERVRAYDLTATALPVDEEAARVAELELVATIGDATLSTRSVEDFASLSRITAAYRPWVRLLAARAKPDIIPELMASSVDDNATVLARLPNILALVHTPPQDRPPSILLRLFQYACTPSERDEAIAILAKTTDGASKWVRDQLQTQVDACIAERATIAPLLRTWLRGSRGVARRR